MAVALQRIFINLAERTGAMPQAQALDVLVRNTGATANGPPAILGGATQTVATTGGPQGIEGFVVTTNPTDTVALGIATIGNAQHTGAGVVTELRGVEAQVGNTGTGTVTRAVALHATGGFAGGGGTTDVYIGLEVENITIGTTKYAIYTGTGQNRFGDDVDLASGKVYQVNGTQVVGAQGAAVADASGGGVIDAEARTALNTLLARLRVHGLIDT
jgi:hypothetical protein